MVTIKIRTDNAAFEDDNGRTEVARILRNAAKRIEEGEELPITLMDTNGNRVGEAI